MLNILINLVNQILFLSQGDNKGIPSLILLIIFIVIYLLINISGRIVCWVALKRAQKKKREKEEEKKKEKKMFASSSIVNASCVVAGLCYLIGSNITAVVLLDKEHFDCSTSCILIVNDFATVLQAIASVLFAIIETHSRKIYLCLTGASNDDDDRNDKWLIWAKTAEILAFIRIFDAVFSTVAELPTDQDETCLSHERVVMWFMYVLLLLVWFILLAVVVINGLRNTKYDLEHFVIVFIALAVFISSAFLLIGSNNEPLGCSYNCDLYRGNMTETCDQKAFHETRVSLLTVSLVLISVPTTYCIGVYCYRLKPKRNKIHVQASTDKKARTIILCKPPLIDSDTVLL